MNGGKRWLRLYFHILLPERKWHIDNHEVRVGDSGLVRDLLVRGQFKRGEVTQVNRSLNDDRVRSVDLRYKIVCADKPSYMYKEVKNMHETRDVKI